MQSTKGIGKISDAFNFCSFGILNKDILYGPVVKYDKTAN